MKKTGRIKKLLAFILLFSMLLSLAQPIYAYDEIKIIYNGEVIKTDVPPIIIDGRTLVPVRAVFETMGYDVEWTDHYTFADRALKDAGIDLDLNKEYQRVHICKKVESTYNSGYDITDIYIYIGVNVMEKHSYNSLVNDDGHVIEKIAIDIPAQIIDGRTMIPVRAAAEALDINVGWEGKTSTVMLKDKRDENITFAFKLKEYMPSDENYMISPFSIKVALSMAANGDTGAAREEILAVLGISDLDAFNEYVKTFIEQMNTAKEENAEFDAAESAEGFDDEFRTNRTAEFELADSIWLNKDYYGVNAPNIGFAPEFKKLVSEYYNATAGTVNKQNAVYTINNWISDKTRGKISNVIDSNDFLAALVNTIYMKAQWENQFMEAATQKDTFTDRNGEQSEIDFMNLAGSFDYYGDGDTQMIRLPYIGVFSMYVVLGDSCGFEVQRDLLESRKVILSLPKWKTESTFDLNSILESMGIKTAFKSGFDSMLINNPEALKIGRVIHKTYIDVDENGTEAAAVTAMLMVGTAVMPEPNEPVKFKADKPFTYFICDDTNGEILFMGEYAYVQ